MDQRFTDGVKNAWRFAIAEAQKLGSEYVGVEHLLMGIASEKDSAGGKILHSFGITPEKIEQLLGGAHTSFFNRELYIAPRTKRVLELAAAEANELGNNYVGTEHLLLAILREGDGMTMSILERFGVTEEKMQKAFETVMNESGKGGDSATLGDLSDYAIDLNERAKQGKIDPVIGRTNEINRVIQILSRRNKNNPVLIGEPGVGKTAIAEGLAQRIVENDVPEILKNCHIISLNMSSMVAGTKYRGEFEERLKKVIEEVKKHPEWILFIDELHTLVGAGATEGSMDAANIMKPALARGELRCIGATTLKEYKKYIEKDAALERRFQPVKVGEPTNEETVQILQGLRDKYEAFHKVKIPDEAIKEAVRLSSRYITDRFQPDKAIDVIDEAAAKIRMEASSAPKGLKQKEDELANIQKEKEAAVSAQNFEKAAVYRDQAKKLSDEIENLKKDWKGADQDHLAVTPEDIAEVVAKWTGIPLQNLTQSDSERLLHLEDELHKRVVGQEEAVHAVAKAIRRARAGMKDPHRPIGSFMFLGTTGVGKTELAKALAECMFGSEKALIRFDMSEFMEKHEVSRLVGAPPGYVGYDEGGQLTDAVRKNPYSVILFDEVEKAHADFFNILLQVLDDGRLTDGQGRTVDFTNTVIIMTSNLGSTLLREHTKSMGFTAEHKEGETTDFEEIKGKIMDTVKRTFRPEFINRIDEIIVFHPLTEDDLKKIVRLLMVKVEKKMDSMHVALKVSDKAFEQIIKDGTDVEYGARPLRRTIQREVEDAIAELILEGTLKGKNTLHIDVDDKGKLVFTAD
ncbi:MAG: ATP-dependent Clp protease ATP-binding subunit [Allisonella histaminiformans]|uniref:ATP-dependent Clp protease ATP-binding subunit ClpC n=1 Tax=Allisonella histaminiformans TaxID=209880 RepID=A0A1G5V8I3_9FIRM|nr:ATP-dependent Clp protease ATP-binding subunit [Allisonella histaminiformans]MCI6003655.1 ATP-dependent Clp protease ATP-binding subunit [Allisonella histaminiformans]MDY4540947.1 ATP-dependent Clp protease ATP-binding subunit [Allisonella histaminiformans]SDA41706.1 ATP-dependent Clp protease ATP-binding subunit ClpC [Allisonella histaminiformans]